ncbi:MAG: alpha/beta hydrolase [Christensenella sp.]|nr:alpha/beta hydrolase [Christensenella sp.]
MHNKITFPVGYHAYNKQQVFNYQLNRWHSVGMARHEDCVEAGKQIHVFGDWKTVLLQYAKTAEQENRLLNAAIYYRAAEFYTMHDPESKASIYRKFIQLFYEAVKGESFVREFVPYETGKLPIIRFFAEGKAKGTILLHAGFDSFLEEWLFIMMALSQSGYDVIGFEGPGQGHMLIEQGVSLDYRWERPVACILDYYTIAEASIFGFSMGGWFAMRASANEPRIKNTIVSGHAVDYSRIPPKFMRDMMMFFIKHMRDYTAKSFEATSHKEGINGWQTYQLANITKRSPLEAFEYALGMNAENLGSSNVTQNVLYLTGSEDHFVPMKMHDWQISLLNNCKSLTDHVFTKETQAQNHCMVGNIGLMVQEITSWLNSFSGQTPFAPTLK